VRRRADEREAEAGEEPEETGREQHREAPTDGSNEECDAEERVRRLARL